jgi:hypothetical protein
MPSFADIQNEISNIMDVPVDQMDEEQKAAWDAYANELGEAQADKVDKYGQFRRLEMASADALEYEGKRLIAKAKIKRTNLEWLDNYYLANMQANGERKIRGKIYDISIRHSTAVQITDEKSLPQEFVRTTVTTAPDKARIKEKLRAGYVITGAELVKKPYLLVS